MSKLQDIKDQFMDIVPNYKTPRATNPIEGQAKFIIDVEQIFGIDQLNSRGDVFSMVHVVYRVGKDKKLLEKKCPAFTKQGRLIIHEMEEYTSYEVSAVKVNGFWEWVSVNPIKP